MENEKEKPKEPEEKPRMVEDANLAAKRLEEANKVTKELVERQEALTAENALGGKADAGGEPEKKKEDTPEEYAEKLLKGEVNPAADDGII